MTTSKQKTSKKAQSSRKLVSADKVEVLVNSPIVPATLNPLSSVEQTMKLFDFFSENQGMSYAPAFQPLLGALDEAAEGLIIRLLRPELPTTKDAKQAWFKPNMDGVKRNLHGEYRKLAQGLKRILVNNNGLSPIGLLRSCLDYALNGTPKIDGVFTALRTQVWVQSGRRLLEIIDRINKFRNTYIAHSKKGVTLTDSNIAREELNVWLEALRQLSGNILYPSAIVCT